MEKEIEKINDSATIVSNSRDAAQVDIDKGEAFKKKNISQIINKLLNVYYLIFNFFFHFL